MHKFINALFWAALLSPVLSFGWDAEKNVSEYPAGRDYAVMNNTWFLDLFSDTAYIVWERWVGDSVPSPAFARWTWDNGVSWSPAQNQILGDGHYMSLAVSNGVGHLMVCRADPPIGTEYYRSTNSGQSWSYILTLDFATINWNSIAVDSNMIHAVWQGFSAPYPYRYRRSIDNGLNWESMQTLATVTSVTPIPSIAAICQQYVYLAYTGGSGFMTGDTICFMGSVDGGVTWSSPAVLGIGASLFLAIASPCVAARSNYVYVVWNGGTISSKIKFRRSADYGATWMGTVDIANGSYPNLYTIGPYVYMAYAGTDGSLKFKMSSDWGASWGAEETPAPNAKIGYTPGPSIVVSPTGNAHIAWTDVRYEASGDTGEIFYVHGTVPAGVYKDSCGPAGVESRQGGTTFSVTNKPWGFAVKYELEEPGVLKIYNIAGTLVKVCEVTHSCEIRMGNLPSGIYLLTLKTPTHYLRTKGVYLR